MSINFMSINRRRRRSNAGPINAAATISYTKEALEGVRVLRIMSPTTMSGSRSMTLSGAIDQGLIEISEQGNHVSIRLMQANLEIFLTR